MDASAAAPDTSIHTAWRVSDLERDGPEAEVDARGEDGEQRSAAQASALGDGRAGGEGDRGGRGSG